MINVLQEAAVEAVKDDFVSERDLNDPDVQPWYVVRFEGPNLHYMYMHASCMHIMQRIHFM